MSLGAVSKTPEGGGKRKMVFAVVAVMAVLLVIVLIIAAVGGYVYYTKYYKNSVGEGAMEYPTDGLLVINVTTSIPTTSTPTTSVLATSTLQTTLLSTSIPTTTVKATCYDGSKNQGEIDVDCGGPCLPCVKTAADVAACFSSKSVILYTRDPKVCWLCSSIKNYFGSAYESLDIRYCGDREECDDLKEELIDEYGVDEDQAGFPTWILYGIAYPAASVKKMQAETGCT